MKIIAHIHTAFPCKFGVPRQSGERCFGGQIVFTPKYRNPDSIRGIEGFSHLWILWRFDVPSKDAFIPTVRPPRLGGNVKMGVFATRSPFRPNPIALSLVTLESIENTAHNGTVLNVSGVDMVDGTAIFDIKPYLPYVEAITNAKGGFGAAHRDDSCMVQFEQMVYEKLPLDLVKPITQMLESNPIPHYKHDANHIYGVQYMNWEIKFILDGNMITVKEAYIVKED